MAAYRREGLMVNHRRRPKLVEDVPLIMGQWVRLPGVNGVELCQLSGPPLSVPWYAYGRLPNGASMCVPADLCQDEDGRVLVAGYWDLSKVRRHCLIRHPDLADPAAAVPDPRSRE